MEALGALTGFFAGTAHAQTAPLLRVFLDCDRCDQNYLTENVAFVDYVRDRTVADLHVLVTTQETGGGGLLLNLRQLWGSLNLSANLLEHLNDLSRRRMSLFSNADVRLFKGFSFDYFGGYDKINDLIGLRKGEASTEDVLIKIQQLATGYSYFFGFGINYRFGSIFNNIVNPRFGD